MLSPYNPHTPAQRARSNAPIARSSLQNQMVSNFFQDDFFSDFHQEFQNFSNRMLSRFDGHFSNFGNFASPFSSMLKSFDEDFALMNNFSDLHQNMARNNGSGTVIQRSYVSSTTIGKDGKKQHEKYFSNNVAHKGNDGNIISEKQEGYRHSGKGIDRMGQERMLNDKGRKIVKERNKILNEESAHNYFYNIDENQKDEFDREWNNYNNKVRFMDNHQKFLGYSGNSRNYLPQRENIQPEYYQRNYQDDRNRGDFIPSYKKLDSMPVRLNQYNQYGDSNYYPRQRASDLQPAPLALGNANYQQPVNQNVPLQYRGSVPSNQRIPAVRNKQDQQAGVFRNKGVGRNDIPKAG